MPTIILSKIGSIEIDLVSQENHRYETQITENPLEDGTVIADHLVNRPVVLEMDGRLTDTPFSGIPFNPLEAVTGLLDGILPGPAKEKALALITLQETKVAFDVVTGLHTYSNMAIERLDFPRSSQDGRSIRFNATMKELLIVGGDAKSNRERIAEEVRNTALSPSNLGVVPKSAIELTPV